MIQFDVGKARRQAVQIEEVACALSRMTKAQYEKTMQNLQGSWKGDSAEKFFRKAARLGEEMESASRQLRQTASAIQNAARMAEMAEAAAARLAEKREYE